MIELQRAIINMYKTTSLYPGTKLYFTKAPDSSTYPYCVYTIVANTTWDKFAERGEEVLIQINAYSDKNSSTEVNTMRSAITDVFDDAKLDVSGYDTVSCVREFAFIDLDVDNKIWQYSIQYRVMLEKQ